MEKILIIILLLTTSCGIKKDVSEESTIYIAESSVERVQEKEVRVDTVYIPSNSSFTIPPISREPDSNQIIDYKFDTGHSELTVKSDSTGRIHVESVNKGITSRSKEVTRLIDSISTVAIEKAYKYESTKVKTKIPLWVWMSYIVFILIIYILINRIRRK